MINNTMNTEENKQETQKTEEIGPEPEETGGFYFSSFLKISDPNSEEILVQIRGDN